jgi:cytochrome c553
MLYLHFQNHLPEKYMKKLLLITVVLSLVSTVSVAGDAAAGKAKAAVCAGCHGIEGISSNTLWPNLAGQQEGYLVKQIKAFRDGERKDPMMAPMVAGLSDDDIANLSAYYASLK